MPETPGLSNNPYKDKSYKPTYQSQVGSPLLNSDPGIVGTGVAGSEYDANTPLGDLGHLGKIRAERQSDWTAAGNMVLQSLATVAGQSLDAVGSLLMGVPKMAYNALNNKSQDYTNPLSDAGRNLQDWTQNMAPIFADPDRSFGHAAWWMQNAPSVASTMAMFIPQLAVAKGVGGLARWMRLGENATEMAQVGLGALAGRHAENYMEAGSVYKNAYDDAVKRGIDEETAKKNAGEAASLDYSMNYANLGFDILELASVLKPLKSLTGGVVGSRFTSLRTLGYEAANARSLDMTGKALLDGAKWYEKAALQSYRFARPVVAQLGEGIEEGINTISQKEGERKARMLNGTPNADDDSTFLDRMSKYVVDKDVAQSAFWGVVGGVVTHAAGVAFTKGDQLLRGKDANVSVGVKAADIAKRKEYIADYLKVQNDPNSTPIEKLKVRHKALFNLTQSAIDADNLDLLLGDMEDKEYQGILAKQSGIDPTMIKPEMSKLKDDINYISDAYDNYAGLSKNSWANFNQEVNTSVFADDPNKKEMVKRGFFQFVEGDVANHLTQMDYYSHIANKTTAEANLNINAEYEKINNGHLQYKPIMDNILRSHAIDYHITHYQKELATLEKAGVSEDGLEVTKTQITALKDQKVKLEKDLQTIKDVTDYDVRMNGGESEFDKIAAEVDVNKSVPAVLKNYVSIIDDQMTKLRFARERNTIIKNGSKYYANFIEDAAKLKDYHKTRDEEQKRYGYTESDSEPVKELKRKVIDTFDTTLKADDKRYHAGDRAVYEQRFKDAYETHAQSNEDLKPELDKVADELKQFDTTKPDSFDFDKYTKLRAEQDALQKVITEKKPPEAEQSAPTGYDSEPVTRSDADFNAGVKEAVRRISALKTPMADEGINSVLAIPYIMQQMAEIAKETDDTKKEALQNDISDYIEQGNESFLGMGFSSIQKDAYDIVADTYKEYNNEILNVINSIDQFIKTVESKATAFAGNEVKDEETEQEQEKEIIEEKQVQSKNDPDEILHDDIPEPQAVNLAAKTFQDEAFVSKIELSTPAETNSANNGFVSLSHGGSLIAKDYQNHVPVLNPKFEGNRNSSMFDLSLLDPDSPNYLQPGDNIEITQTGNNLEVWKIAGDSRYRMGYVDDYVQHKGQADEIRKLLASQKNKKLTANLASNALNFGEALNTEAANPDAPKAEKKVFIPVPLSKAVPLEIFNKPGGPYLTINDGTRFGLRGADNAIINIKSLPDLKNARIITEVKPQYAGQLEVIIPTNKIPNGQKTKSGESNPNGKRVYQARLGRTANVESIKTKSGDNMAVAVLKKLVDPYHNEAFIKSLEPITGIKFDADKPLVNQKHLIERLYTNEMVNRIMNQILYSRAAKNKDDITGMGFKYPFYVDVKRNKKIVIEGNEIVHDVSLSVRFKKDRVPAYHYFGVGGTNLNATDVVAKFAEIGKVTDAKPFRLDAKRIGDRYNSGAYTGFGLENGEIAAKTYPNGYLQYLSDNNLVHVTFAAIPYTYNQGGQQKTAYTFFGEPRIKINLEDIHQYKPEVGKTNKAPAQGGIAQVKINGFGEQRVVADNKPENVIRFLEDTTILKLADDQKAYVDRSGDRYDRVGSILGNNLEQPILAGLPVPKDKGYISFYHGSLPNYTIKTETGNNYRVEIKDGKTSVSEYINDSKFGPIWQYMTRERDLPILKKLNEYEKITNDKTVIVNKDFVFKPSYDILNNKNYLLENYEQSVSWKADYPGFEKGDFTSHKNTLDWPSIVGIDRSKYMNDATKFERSFKSKELENQYYQDVTNKVEEYIKKLKSTTRLEQASEFGTSIDSFVRDFFSSTNYADSRLSQLKSNDAYKGIPGELLTKLFVGLTQLKKQFQANGETPYTDHRIVFDRTTKRAGELDILTVDKQNKIRYYDVKTFKGTLEEMVKTNDQRIEKWTNQLNAYRILAKNQHNIEVSEMNIVGISLGYGSENKEVITLNVDGILPLRFKDEVKGTNGTFKLQDTAVKTLIEGMTSTKAPVVTATSLPDKMPSIRGVDFEVDKANSKISVLNKGKKIGEATTVPEALKVAINFSNNATLTQNDDVESQKVDIEKKRKEELKTVKSKEDWIKYFKETYPILFQHADSEKRFMQQLSFAAQPNNMKETDINFSAYLFNPKAIDIQIKQINDKYNNELAGLENADISKNVVGSILTEMYNSNSISALLVDPSVTGPQRNNLIELMNSAIIDVFYQEYLGNGNRKIDIDKQLKPMVKAVLQKKLAELQKDNEDSAMAEYEMRQANVDASVIKAYTEQFAKTPGYIAYYNDVLAKFDNQTFDEETKKKVGEFVGYFKTSFYFVSGSKLIKNITAEDDVLDLDVADESRAEGLTQRHQEDWYAKVNPKNTPTFQTKIFLSRVPKQFRNKQGDVVTGQYELTPAGNYQYYALDDILASVHKSIDDVRSDHFFEDLGKIDNPIVQDALAAIDQMDNLGKQSNYRWKFTREMLQRKLASSVILQSRKVKTIQLKLAYNEGGEITGANANIFDSNRQQIEEQVINTWESNFRNAQDRFYNITVDEKNGIPTPKISGLKKRGLKTYNKADNALTLEMPTVAEIGTMNGGVVNDALNDAKFLLYSQLKNIAQIAVENPDKTHDVVLPVNKDSYTIRSAEGTELTTLDRSDIQNLINYVSWPTNVRFAKEDISKVTNIELHSVRDSMKAIIDSAISQNNAYSGTSYTILADQLGRMGINMAEDANNGSLSLFKLQSGEPPLFRRLDPQSNTLKDYLTDNVLNLVHNFVNAANPKKSDEDEEIASIVDVNTPFADFRLKLKNLARVAKPGFPNIYNPNVVTGNGDKTYTINPQTYLSTRINQFRNDKELRDAILNNPFSGRSTIINQLVNDEKSLSTFNIHYFGEINIDTNTTSNKKMNDIKQILADYAGFHNQEQIDKNDNGTKARGVGYYITPHGESKTAPMISLSKRNVQTDFVEDKNGNISIALDTNSSLFTDVFSQFRSELDRVIHGQKVLNLLREMEKEKGFEKALVFAQANYKPGFHYNVGTNSFLPGSAMKFTLWGKEMFNDTRKEFFTSAGDLLPEIQTLITDTENDDVLKDLRKSFKLYADDFLTNELNHHIEHLDKYNNRFYKKGKVKLRGQGFEFYGTNFPLFDRRYINKMNLQLVNGVNPVKVWSYDNDGKFVSENLIDKHLVPLSKALDTSAMTAADAKAHTDSVEARNKEAQNTKFYDYHKRYILADFVFNHLLFKNTYFQITEDPADFNKSDKYETLKEEIDKRLKHHLGPGNQTAEMGNNEMRVIYFNDVTPGYLKKEVGFTEWQSQDHHVKQLVTFMQNDKGTKVKGKLLSDYVRLNDNSYTLPSNYETLAGIYTMYHDEPAKLRKILFDNLNQEMSDAGSFMSKRETVVRMVKAGDIDIKDAFAVYKAMADEKLNETKLKDLEKKYGFGSLLVNKFIYSGNKISQYGEGDKKSYLNDFQTKKDAEVSLSGSLIKGREWEKISKDIDDLENAILKEKGIDPYSPEAFETALGIGISPMSARKSSGSQPISLFNEDGTYTGLIKTAPVTVLDRNYHREQLSKEIKEVNEITASTQALPNSQMDVTSDIDFARVNNSNTKFKDGFTNVQQNNARYEVLGELMQRDLADSFIKTGVRMVNGWPHIDDIRTFLGSVRQQMINQNGGSPVVLESFKVDEATGRLPMPLSMSPFGGIAQSVILNGYNKPITGRKMSGQSYFTMSPLGFSVQTNDTLKGFRLRPKRDSNLFDSREAVLSYYTPEELALDESGKKWVEKVISNGIEKYRGVLNEVLPAEVALSWRFTGTDGKLLDYEKYVNEDGTPKTEMFDPEVLNIIGFRVPNTPHNTMSYLNIVRFLPSAHKDLAQVNPQLMTNMSSDHDADTLYTYQYNTDMLENGKLIKVQGVVHPNQVGHESLLNTTKNKEEVRNRELHKNYNYLKYKKELLKKQEFYFEKRKQLQDAMDDDLTIPVEQLLLDPVAKKKYVDLLNEYNKIEAEMKDPNQDMRELYYAVQNGDMEAITAFQSKYEEIVNDVQQSETNPEEIEKLAKQQLLEYIDTVAGVVKSQEKAIRKGKGFKVNPQYLALVEQLKGELATIEIDNRSAIEKLGDEDMESLKGKIKDIEAEFNKTFDFSKASIYKKQTKQQLENAMLETFMLSYSNPNVFKKMITPLSTDFLKDRLNDKVLEWYDDKGNIQRTSIQEGIVNKGYSSINGYQSQSNFKNTSSENADLIGVFASTLRVAQVAQNHGLFFAPDDSTPNAPIYGKVELNDEKKFITKKILVDGKLLVDIKRDNTPTKDWTISDKHDNMIYRSGGIQYYNRDPAYVAGGLPMERKPDVTNRYRFDAIYDYDNFKRKVNVSTTLEASLQAVLDGIKDPIAPKIKLTMSNVNAYVGHLMLRYYDEIVPLFHQPILDQYELDVKQEGVKRMFVTDESKMTFISDYITKNTLFNEAIVAKVFKKTKNPILALETLLVDMEPISSVTLTDSLVKYNGLDGTKREDLLKNSDFHYKQLSALLNFLRAEKIGSQFTTLHIALNTFSKGLPGSILELNEKAEAFKDLHRLDVLKRDNGDVVMKDQKPVFALTSTVPNIGNVHTISKLLQQGADKPDTKKSFYELPVINGLLPIQSLMKNMDNSVFTELTPLFRNLYERYDELRKKSDERSKPGKKTKLATFLTSYIWSNPELYRDMFDSEEEYNYFTQFGRDALMVHSKEATKALEEVKDPKVFPFNATLAETAQRLANKRFKGKDGVTYASVYKILNAFKYITGNSKLGSPDFILYMNIADYKGTFENELAMSIPLMLDSKDAEVRALAKQLVIYAHLSGGISTPNSYIKHIPQSIRDRFGMSKRLRDYLDGINDGKTPADQKRRYDVVHSALISYFQHYPFEAPVFDKKDLRVKDSKAKEIFFVHPEMGRSMAYIRQDRDWAYEKDVFAARLAGTNKVYGYSKINGYGAMVELDKLGKSRWSYNESTYSEDLHEGITQVFENMAGSVKRDLLFGKRELNKTNSKADGFGFTKADQYQMEIEGEDLTSGALLTGLAGITDNEAYKALARELGPTSKIPIEIVGDQDNGQRIGGTYNQATDKITINKDAFFDGEYVNVPGYEKTLLHEITHGQLDRAITSILNPDRKFDLGEVDADGKAIQSRFLTKQQFGLIEPAVTNLTKSIAILDVIASSPDITGNDVINEQIEKYDRYVQAGDRYFTDQMDYVNFFKNLTAFKEKGYNLSKPNKANKKEMDEVAGLVKEFSTYFLTNKDFQSLLNDIVLDDNLKDQFKEATKGSKNIWQAVMKWFMDILNTLTGGKLTSTHIINARGIIETKVDENTLAHAAASNILSLLQDVKVPNSFARAATATTIDISDLETNTSPNIVGTVSNFNFSDNEVDKADIMGKCK
jgi:hypothetical protein